jgi:hypothetical protein
MNDTGFAKLIVEVLHDRGSGMSPDWSLGSGCAVREGLVLTAARNVGDPDLLTFQASGSLWTGAKTPCCEVP